MYAPLPASASALWPWGYLCTAYITLLLTLYPSARGEERKALKADELAWVVPAFAVCVLCLSCASLFRLMQKVASFQTYLMYAVALGTAPAGRAPTMAAYRESRNAVAIVSAFSPQPCAQERSVFNRAACEHRNRVFRRGKDNHANYARLHGYPLLSTHNCASPAVEQALGLVHPAAWTKVFLLQMCIRRHPHISWFMWIDVRLAPVERSHSLLAHCSVALAHQV